jgi:hypothetical protein
MKEIEIVSLGDKMSGFYPVYLNGMGKYTRILLQNGESYDEKRQVRTILQLFARGNALDMPAARREYGQIVGQKNQLPIPLNQRMVLVPFRVLKAVTPKEGTVGYFVLDKILGYREIQEEPFRALLYLDGEHRVRVLQSVKTIQKYLNMAKVIRQVWEKKTLNGEKTKLEEYQKPATKQDVALLIRELCDLKYQILSGRGITNE